MRKSLFAVLVPWIAIFSLVAQSAQASTKSGAGIIAESHSSGITIDGVTSQPTSAILRPTTRSGRAATIAAFTIGSEYVDMVFDQRQVDFSDGYSMMLDTTTPDGVNFTFTRSATSPDRRRGTQTIQWNRLTGETSVTNEGLLNLLHESRAFMIAAALLPSLLQQMQNGGSLTANGIPLHTDTLNQDVEACRAAILDTTLGEEAAIVACIPQPVVPVTCTLAVAGVALLLYHQSIACEPLE